MVIYFFDTYSIIELIKNNPRFLKYSDLPVTTTILNKIEFYWWALNFDGEEYADKIIKFVPDVQEITDDVIREAMSFRKEHKKQNFAYADAIGYAFARKHGLLFLTGDKQFKDLPGVEFVQ